MEFLTWARGCRTFAKVAASGRTFASTRSWTLRERSIRRLVSSIIEAGVPVKTGGAEATFAACLEPCLIMKGICISQKEWTVSTSLAGLPPRRVWRRRRDRWQSQLPIAYCEEEMTTSSLQVRYVIIGTSPVSNNSHISSLFRNLSWNLNQPYYVLVKIFLRPAYVFSLIINWIGFVIVANSTHNDCAYKRWVLSNEN